MKNIEKILSELGIELTEEQSKNLAKEVQENYKPIADWQKQVDNLKAANEKLEATEEALKKFDGIDMEALNKQIADLKADLKKKDEEHQKQIADRDFDDLVKSAIMDAKGKNAKAIRALLDLDVLKESKNQEKDIASAIKKLSEAEDSRFLFGEPDPKVIGTGNPIGEVTKKGSVDAEEAAMRSAMGLDGNNNKED